MTLDDSLFVTGFSLLFLCSLNENKVGLELPVIFIAQDAYLYFARGKKAEK